MFKFTSEFVGVNKEELPWPSMQIVDHCIVSQGSRSETWVLAHQGGKLYYAIKGGVMSNRQIDRTGPSFWRDPETCLPPPELDPAHLYPKVLSRYTHFYPDKGVEEKDVYKKQRTLLKPDHRRLREALNTSFIAQITAREIDICQVLRLHPHESICQYYGLETTRVLRFKYRNNMIELLMDRERVLNLVFEKYECNLWEAIERGYPVHVRDCLESVAAGIQHMQSPAIVHGDIKPENIFVRLPKGAYDPIPTRYVIGDFDSAQPTGWKVCGKYGTPFWSRTKKDRVDTVEEDDNWFAFDQLRKWLVGATGRTHQNLKDYEGIGKKVGEVEKGRKIIDRYFALSDSDT